jgi:hypothetical protein
MRIIIGIVLIFVQMEVFSQKSIVGDYYSYCNRLSIFEDSTFRISEFQASWAKGTWRIHSDTLLLEYVPIYDSVIIYTRYSLPDLNIRNLFLAQKNRVLSSDEVSNSFVDTTASDYVSEAKMKVPIGSHYQNKELVPPNLLITKNILYDFDSLGKPITRNCRNFQTNKKIKCGRMKMNN